MQNVPTLPDVKAWLGIEPGDTVDDAVLQESLDASLDAQCRAVAYPRDLYGDACFSADLREAVMLRTQRLAARRNSPEGIVGLTGAGGDFVSARLPSYDADISALEGPYLKIPVA